MDLDIAWLYLAIFLIIPLARIIPRLIAKRKSKIQRYTDQEPYRNQEPDTNQNYRNQNHRNQEPQTDRMRVLGALSRGLKTFEKIQKDTRIEGTKLDEILSDLERDGLLIVRQKQGIMGTRIELHLKS